MMSDDQQWRYFVLYDRRRGGQIPSINWRIRKAKARWEKPRFTLRLSSHYRYRRRPDCTERYNHWEYVE